MVSDQNRGLLFRTILTIAFPPLKIVFTILDVICILFRQLCGCIGRLLKLIYLLLAAFVANICKLLERLGFGPAIRYERLKSSRKVKPTQESPQLEALPYENECWRRFLTQTGGLLLGLALYLFVYYVLVKHHSVLSISLAVILILPYLLVLENSHSIRAIMMLCLPIMFTNRGRALVFCCMLAIMLSGPLRNSQLNINQLHKSLNCSKQYLILRTDEYGQKNVVNRLMQADQIIQTLIDNIKQFAEDLRKRLQVIVQLALTLDKYIKEAIGELKRIVDICNQHSQEYKDNCKRATDRGYLDCKRTLGLLSGLCELVRPTGRAFCETKNWPAKFCEIGKSTIIYLKNQIEARLLSIEQAIKDMLYVDVDIKHSYSFNGTKTKSFRKVISEIKFDVEQKFWYIRLVVRLFNLITLILVVWITLTATLYHMHYLDNIGYDNMYLDTRLKAIDEHRKRRIASDRYRDRDQTRRPSTERGRSEESNLIFPMTRRHQEQYLKPFGLWMNEMERQKLLIASLVWLIIVSYISFFVLLDFGLYQLLQLINTILNDILFKSDLPLIDVTSKSANQVVHYNRTHLSHLREVSRARRPATNGTRLAITSMYWRLMDSLERNIPDDVMILDSLQECLPRASQPNYGSYRKLVYLAALTFGGVILEAYALRLRHWIANLYYPNRAKRRAIWLYRKILSEKAKYERNQDRDPELLAAEMLGRAINK